MNPVFIMDFFLSFMRRFNLIIPIYEGISTYDSQKSKVYTHISPLTKQFVYIILFFTLRTLILIIPHYEDVHLITFSTVRTCYAHKFHSRDVPPHGPSL